MGFRLEYMPVISSNGMRWIVLSGQPVCLTTFLMSAYHRSSCSLLPRNHNSVAFCSEFGVRDNYRVYSKSRFSPGYVVSPWGGTKKCSWLLMASSPFSLFYVHADHIRIPMLISLLLFSLLITGQEWPRRNDEMSSCKKLQDRFSPLIL